MGIGLNPTRSLSRLAMRGMRPELRLILPVVFVFDSGPRAPEGTSGSQFGCML